ncbi:hypothetical protein Tco_0665354, partial [Tanacetum coccineum]
FGEEVLIFCLRVRSLRCLFVKIRYLDWIIGSVWMHPRSGAVREEIFSQRYRFRSLEYEQERVAVTFRAIWRPVLALEAWAGQMDAQRAALWHAISDV